MNAFLLVALCVGWALVLVLAVAAAVCAVWACWTAQDVADQEREKRAVRQWLARRSAAHRR